MGPNPGDVVLIDVPFAESAKSKPRPALVLAAPDPHGDFVILPITTTSTHSKSLQLGANHFAQGGLPQASWVRTDHVFTVNNQDVVKLFGKLQVAALQSILKLLCPHLGCK